MALHDALRQRESGLRQGDGLFSEYSNVKVPNANQQSIISEALTSSPAEQVIEAHKQFETMGSRSVTVDHGQPLASTDSDSHLEFDTGTRNIQSAFKEHTDPEALPRVPTLIQQPISIPPPIWIPPPPAPVEETITKLHLERLSVGMESPPSEVLPTERTEDFDLSDGSGLSLKHLVTKEPTFNDEYERVQKSRLECWSLRLRVHEIRYKLREKQRIKSTADDKLLQRFSLQEFGLFPPKGGLAGVVKSNAELMKDCRDASAEYGPLEDDCNRLEDELSEREFELTRMEERFYARWKSPSTDRNVEPFFAAIHQSSPTPSNVSDIEEVPEEHPFVTELLSRMGDLDILQERLVDLEEDKESLEEERASRQRFGKDLASDNQIWLDKSQSVKEDLLGRIRITEEDLNRLRQRCFSLGLVDEYGEPTDFQSQERRTFQDEEDMNPKGQMSEYVKHPTLLPKPGVKPTLSKDLDDESDQTSDTLGGRINHWILHRLRESPLEVSLLARTFEGRYGQLDGRWDVAVLEVWNDDETINATGYHVYTSSMTTRAPFRSNHSSVSSNNNLNILGNPYRLIVGQQLRFSLSPDDSEETEDGTVTGNSSHLRNGKLHWNNEL